MTKYIEELSDIFRQREVIRENNEENVREPCIGDDIEDEGNDTKID